jgi:hypothetical protein
MVVGHGLPSPPWRQEEVPEDCGDQEEACEGDQDFVEHEGEYTPLPY